jgi:LysM repeat protein
MPPRPKRRARPRHTWESYAAPLAFLVAVTVAALLVRSALRQPTATATTTAAAAATTTRAKPAATTQRTPPPTSTAAARFYVVQAGDSFGAIAAKTGTSVAEIERLNPGVASTSLHIGQKIRVG